jgi:hypothetical protein
MVEIRMQVPERILCRFETFGCLLRNIYGDVSKLRVFGPPNKK